MEEGLIGEVVERLDRVRAPLRVAMAILDMAYASLAENDDDRIRYLDQMEASLRALHPEVEIVVVPPEPRRGRPPKGKVTKPGRKRGRKPKRAIADPDPADAPFNGGRRCTLCGVAKPVRWFDGDVCKKCRNADKKKAAPKGKRRPNALAAAENGARTCERCGRMKQAQSFDGDSTVCRVCWEDQ